VTLQLPRDLVPIHERSAESEADHPQPAEQRPEVHASRQRDHLGAAQRQGAHPDAVGDRHRHRHRQADQDRIFEDFRQLDNSPTAPTAAPGSACPSAGASPDARRAYHVQSQVGKGSTFT
jgi:hypothetical protein